MYSLGNIDNPIEYSIDSRLNNFTAIPHRKINSCGECFKCYYVIQ